MTSYAARRINAGIRNHDRLMFLGTLTDHSAVHERALSEAVVCPYCPDETKVHPANLTAHMAHYHADIAAATDFYAQFDPETRIVLQAHKKRIDDKRRTATQALVDIGQELVEARARLVSEGLFTEWVQLEWGWSIKGAQRFMNVYRAYKHDNLSPLLLQKSALYLLSAPSTPPSARQAALDKAVNGERLSVADTAQLIATHKAVQKVVTTHGVKNPDTVALLERIVDTDSFKTIAATGYLQPGDAKSAVHINDDPRDLQAALLDLSGQHKHEAAVNAEPIPQASIEAIDGVFIATLNLGEYESRGAAQKAITRIMTRLYGEKELS